MAETPSNERDGDYFPEERLSSNSPECVRLVRKLRLSFFLFGLINNVLYVIILSAALDLVPPNTPKGIIAFCNIFPALVAKLGWPYVLKGQIRYKKRLLGCSGLSMLGMIIVAASNSLPPRLLGISFASFSSGLGELTFLQLSTTYAHVSHSLSGTSVGFFASGTGAAGLVGALMWWFLRSLGVKEGVGISSVLPIVIPVTFFFILPTNTKFSNFEFETTAPDLSASGTEYAAIPTAEESVLTSPLLPTHGHKIEVSLTLREKWTLVRPLLLRYMFPLFCVYTFEYTINQGIAPTLVYPPPTTTPLLRLIIKSIRDYYPLWQLIYQSTVFLSRSALTLRIPPLPIRLLPLPAVIQAIILFTLVAESALGIFENGSLESSAAPTAIVIVALLVGVEGICGGLAYVNTFYHVGLEPLPESPKATQEREFKIGSIGFADSLGILLASMVAVPMEIWLCNVQVGRHRNLCRSL